MKYWRLIVCCLAAVACSGFAYRFYADPLVAIAVFQFVFLVLLLSLGFDWKQVLSFEELERKFNTEKELFNTEKEPFLRVPVPPAQHDLSTRIVGVPSSAVLADGKILSLAEIHRSMTETKKFGSTIEDQFQKMLFIVGIGGSTVGLLRWVEHQLAKGNPAQNPDVVFSIFLVKIIAAIAPIALQMALVWGACLYLRKRNREMVL